MLLLATPFVAFWGWWYEIHTYNLALLSPLALLHGPNFDFAAEASAGGFEAVFTGGDVVASELVCLMEGLRKREVGVDGGVDFEVGGTGGGDGLGGGGGEREDVRWVGYG